MYDLGDAFDHASVPEGTNLLVQGPPMTGKRSLAFDILAEGTRQSESVIVVTTKDSAERVVEDYTDVVDAEDPLLGVVDCVTRQQGMGNSQETDLVRYASSPVDLTGIGIELSELLRTFYQERGVTRNRVLLHSLSTLLMYSDLQTVFRFLHVFTGRVHSADGLGLFIVDETAHDEQTMSTIKQLFDGVVEVREAEAGREFRLAGMGDANLDWREF